MLQRNSPWPAERFSTRLRTPAARCAPVQLTHRHLATAVLLAAALCVLGAANAQGWVPERHVELTVPGGAGGSLDGTARAVQRLWQELKLVPVASTVMNRGGGGHAIGYEYVRQRTGDAHQLGLATDMLMTGHIAGYMPFTYTDVTPIAFLLTEYVAFAVRADSPIRTGRDLVEAIKKNPAALSFAMGAARGGTYHLALGVPLHAAGVDMKPVRMAFFTGGGQITQLLGGHVNVAVGGLASAAPHAESGKLRIVARERTEAHRWRTRFRSDVGGDGPEGHVRLASQHLRAEGRHTRADRVLGRRVTPSRRERRVSQSGGKESVGRDVQRLGRDSSAHAGGVRPVERPHGLSRAHQEHGYGDASGEQMKGEGNS